VLDNQSHREPLLEGCLANPQKEAQSLGNNYHCSELLAVFIEECDGVAEDALL
jgi:hypothetical protein